MERALSPAPQRTFTAARDNRCEAVGLRCGENYPTMPTATCSTSTSAPATRLLLMLLARAKVILVLISVLPCLMALSNAADNTKPHKYAEPAELPIKTLQLRAQNFSDSIIQITKDATGYTDLLTEYLLMHPRVVPLDGRALLLQVKDTIEADLRGKAEAVESIAIGAEYTYKKYVDPNKKHEPFDYLRAKRLNTTAFLLTDSPRFRNKPVNLSLSTLHVPSNVFDESQDVLKTVLWSNRLNFDFKKNTQHDRTAKWQYFCSVHGVMRIFPGIAWPLPNDDFDCRSQRWYTQAISSPKDVIILLDTSGSMTGFARDVAMATATQILDSLTSNDFFNVILVSDDITYMDTCLESILIQATSQNKKRVKKMLKEVETEGISNFEQALVEAFTILNQVDPRTESEPESEPREPSGGAGGNQAIMLITTGVTNDYAPIFSKYNSHDQKVRVFSYHVGQQTTGAHQTRTVACNNAGFYSHIRSLADVRQQVQNYAHVMSRPMVMEKASPTAWTGPYKDTLGLGTVLTISKPVYDKKNDTAFRLLGVAAVDILVRDLEKHAPPHKLGVNGYAFTLDNNGHILFHPELKLKWGTHHSPYLESMPLPLLEQGTAGIEAVHEQMVQRESGSRSLEATIMFDGQRRIAKRMQTYFFAPVENTPYSVAVVLPDDYGQNWLDGRRKVADVDLSSFKTSKGKLATWSYCRVTANDSRPDPLETVLRYMDHGQNMRPEYATRCDMELMESLLFDSQATRAAQNFWLKDAMLDHDFTVPAPPQPKHGIESTFVGTKAGFTRYFSLSENFTDAAFMVGQLNTVQEVYYQRSADSSHFVFTVPHQTGKRTSSDQPPLVTITKSLVMSQHGMENIAAVVGLQMKYENLYDIFINATGICPEGVDPCPPTCESPELDCFLLDENGYVVLSDITWEVGKFFGELDGTLMSALIQSGTTDKYGHQQGIFTRVEMYDHQSMCEVWTRRDSSAPPISLNPFQSIFSSLLWFIQELALFLVEFNFYSLFQEKGVRAADSPDGPDKLRDLDNVQEVIEEVLSRLTKFGDGDQVHLWKEDLFREKDVTKEYVLEWYEALRMQYGTRFEGHEACVRKIPAFIVDMDALPQSMAITSCGWCTRPFTVQRVWQTNLILLVADQKCYCQNDPPLLTSPIRLETNDTLVCENAKVGIYRQRPSHKFIRQPEEDTRECGRSMPITPSPSLVFTLVMMTVYNVTSAIWPSSRTL